MRKKLTWIVLLSFVAAVSGCADKEVQQQYYDLEAERTRLVIESINSQTADRAHSQTLMMQSFSTSMTAAAITPSPTDDAMIAMAWGYQMGAPNNIQIPKLQPIKAPPTNVEYIRAWTPLAALAVPFLSGWLWNNGTSGSGSSNSYSADNGGSIILDSGNPGSYNSVGGDYNQSTQQSDYALVNNVECADCDEEGGEVGGQGIETCPDTPTVGKACEGCSCDSLAAGECVCPAPF